MMQSILFVTFVKKKSLKSLKVKADHKSVLKAKFGVTNQAHIYGRGKQLLCAYRPATPR